MTIIIPTWLVITIIILFILNSLYRMYRFGKIVKKIWPIAIEYIKTYKK